MRNRIALAGISRLILLLSFGARTMDEWMWLLDSVQQLPLAEMRAHGLELTPEQIAGFAGRPYAEVALDVLRPFVGGGIADTDLARMAQEAYGTFRHPAVTPLAQLGPGLFVLELFHGPTLAFKDLAMQLVARLMDHVLIQRGERTTIVVATSGDTGGAAVEAHRVDVAALVEVLGGAETGERSRDHGHVAAVRGQLAGERPRPVRRSAAGEEHQGGEGTHPAVLPDATTAV